MFGLLGPFFFFFILFLNSKIESVVEGIQTETSLEGFSMSLMLDRSLNSSTNNEEDIPHSIYSFEVKRKRTYSKSTSL